ncbi:MAG: hypothetical protein M3431_07175, partial [Actinomycetota bacterium]|nr:hypothetical protein [Actinomycetota bacterium]
ARESEQIYQVTPVVEQRAAAGQLPEMVVVHLGTNDAFRGSQLNSLMDALKDVDRVVVLTIHGPGVEWAAANNEQIRALPATYPNVTVLDWDAEVANCVGNCLAAIDQTHLSADGVTFYVERIATALGI